MTIEADRRILGTVSTGESFPLEKNSQVNTFCLKSGEIRQWKVIEGALASEPKSLDDSGNVVKRSVVVEDAIDNKELYIVAGGGKLPVMDRIMHTFHLPPIIGRKLINKPPTII